MVGSACVNAVSEFFNATVMRDGATYSIGFKKGLIDSPFKKLRKKSKKSGTIIEFKLDEEIYPDPIDVTRLIKKFKELTYLNEGLTIKYTIDGETTILKPASLIDYLSDITTKDTIGKPLLFTGQDGNTSVTVALNYCDDYYGSNIVTFVNNINTLNGGDHLNGFKAGITAAVKTLNIKDLIQDDALEGLIAIVSVRTIAPKFEGQNKLYLQMPTIKKIVQDLVTKEFSETLNSKKTFAKQLASKINISIKARLDAKKAKEAARKQKKALKSVVVEKLRDCTSKNPEEKEIFIVEGKHYCPR